MKRNCRDLSEQRLALTTFKFFSRLQQKLLIPLVLNTVLTIVFCGIQHNANAQFTILHKFGDGTVPNDGARPEAGLVLGPDGNYYGTTINKASGGRGSDGVIFRVTPGGTVTILHSFTPGQRERPSAPLTVFQQYLVGVTLDGGVRYPGHHGLGTIFRTNLAGVTVRWHTFNDGSVPDDGVFPNGLTLGADGDLYGTTQWGGYGPPRTFGGFYGTFFKLSQLDHVVTILYRFSTVKGALQVPLYPLLLAKDGNFYGIAIEGPTQYNSIFKMTPQGQLTVFHTFTGGSDGGFPNGPLMQASDGNFYGVASLGPNSANNGMVYKITPDGVVTALHVFSGATDGEFPEDALVEGPNGNLYGVTGLGGTTGWGTVFEISKDGGTYIILHNFHSRIAHDGKFPIGPLLLGTDSNFYGVTNSGGGRNLGIVYRISP